MNYTRSYISDLDRNGIAYSKHSVVKLRAWYYDIMACYDISTIVRGCFILLGFDMYNRKISLVLIMSIHQSFIHHPTAQNIFLVQTINPLDLFHYTIASIFQSLNFTTECFEHAIPFRSRSLMHERV